MRVQEQQPAATRSPAVAVKNVARVENAALTAKNCARTADSTAPKLHAQACELLNATLADLDAGRVMELASYAVSM